MSYTYLAGGQNLKHNKKTRYAIIPRITSFRFISLVYFMIIVQEVIIMNEKKM